MAPAKKKKSSSRHIALFHHKQKRFSKLVAAHSAEWCIVLLEETGIRKGLRNAEKGGWLVPSAGNREAENNNAALDIFQVGHLSVVQHEARG